MNVELNYKNWLIYISDIAYDRDGFHNAKDLGELVDDLHDMANRALKGEKAPIDFSDDKENGDAKEIWDCWEVKND